MQGRTKLGDDYSHYRFEYEKNKNHLHIEGILGKQEMSKSSRAQNGSEIGPKRQREKEPTYLIHEKVENMPPLTGKDVENPVGLFSTELKEYKVRGGR